MTGDVVSEVVVAAPIEEVFAHFVDPARLVRWIGISALLDPRPGGVFRFEIEPGHWCAGRYVEVDPPRRVVFTWGWETVLPVAPGSTTVEVELSEDPRGTHVRLVHRGLDAAMRPMHAEGWGRFLPRLARAAGSEAA
jgi:uncharacterized protein YndB with AHSA1/START domain